MDTLTDNANPGRFGSRGPRDKAVSSPQGTVAKEAWIRRYTGRILKTWRHRETPLGLARTYVHWIHRSLSEHYDQPLMRAFVEKTYPIRFHRDR